MADGPDTTPDVDGEVDATAIDADTDAATDADGGRVKPSKADRLQARAEKLRAREAERAARRAETEQAGPVERATGWIVATAVLAVAAVVLAVFLVLARVDLAHRDDVDTARRQALSTARTWAVKFGSYDYRHLDADIAASSTYMTPSFAKNYRTFTLALAKNLTALKSTVVASVAKAAVISAGTGSAQVLLLLDMVVRTNQTTTPKINRNRLIVDLVHQNGRWLVDKSNTT